MSFDYFLLINQVCIKWTTENNNLLSSMTLDMQILDPTIWSLSKHLNTPTDQFFLDFKYYTPLN